MTAVDPDSAAWFPFWRPKTTCGLKVEVEDVNWNWTKQGVVVADREMELLSS